MKLKALKERYDHNKLSTEQFKLAETILTTLNDLTNDRIDDAKIADIDRLIKEQSNIEKEHFYALMRYFYMIGRTDIYIRLTQYTGGVGVFTRILDRLEKVKGKDIRDEVESIVSQPPLGTLPEDLPFYTEKLMKILKEVLPTERELERVLSGNNHGIPDEVFYEEKAAYEASPSFSEYLKGYHQRQIQTLKEHARTGKPWFEQKITDEVVDFVASNPEIQGGVFKDGFVYETKIPYDIIEWLHAKTPTEKRYYACHCPFARTRITEDLKDIDALWCHCSGGFAKRRYEVIFGRKLHAKPLENALKGDMFCRFAIDLRDIPNLK